MEIVECGKRSYFGYEHEHKRWREVPKPDFSHGDIHKIEGCRADIVAQRGALRDLLRIRLDVIQNDLSESFYHLYLLHDLPECLFGGFDAL